MKCEYIFSADRLQTEFFFSVNSHLEIYTALEVEGFAVT